MTSLLILGNTNQHTFANSIVAANVKSLEIYHEPLKNVFIFHSPESKQKLQEETDWEDYLERNNLPINLFVNRVIDLTQGSESILSFINHFQLVIQGLTDKSRLIIDLTNGTSLQKNLFSIAAYVLDIKDQYAIDVMKLEKALSKKIREIGFVDSVEVLARVYLKIPDSLEFDKIAYLALSEIIRYKSVIDSYKKRYTEIDQVEADWKFFKDNLYHSIQFKLQGDRNKDNTLYRIASASIASSTEDLLNLLIKKFFQSDQSEYRGELTLGAKIKTLESGLKNGLLPKSDFEFLKKFNDFILYLRNKTTHKEGFLSNLERFKADLSLKMSLPFLEFYLDIIYPSLCDKEADELEIKSFANRNYKIDKPKSLSCSQLGSGRAAYYGLDGDDTGRALEELFCSSTDERDFIELSKSVQNAIKEISKYIKQATNQNQSVIFETGDDILFKGCFSKIDLQNMQKIYHGKTQRTCSIGYGWTLQSAYVALKIAKAQPGKNFIYGVEME
ncbi:MAG: mCpol domain-containing protein [Leptolyngbyaceae cyanobacterium SL_5_14]|nr:mCpol domain-containing protein [Leptolyngbyaceae cyanobacterium SL_5_14]